MSAYLLSQDEFQLIADGLLQKIENDHGKYAALEFLELEWEDLPDEAKVAEAITDQVRNLYNLNRLALVTRYSEKYDRNDTFKVEPRITFKNVSDEKFIDALRSLRYQCGEYLADNTELYKALDRYIGKLCEVYFDRVAEKV